MAKSRFEYVRTFERENLFHQETYLVVRVDGRGFHKFSAEYQFSKPNDMRALQVMNSAAQSLMEAIPEILLAYGDSDEYSFLLRKKCELFERRESKLVSTFASTISAYYQFYWNKIIPEKPLNVQRLPTFDARVVMYPNEKIVRDYFSWRQVDCHINNLYNTTFWTLVERGGLTPKEAENKLIGTLSSDKNEILFKDFNINYNNEPEIYKKGTVLVRENPNLRQELTEELSDRQKQREIKKLHKSRIETYHIDLINDKFWEDRPWIFQ
ncbi:tRNA(His) guanylyltransferase [[Candida] anglica]|uniref:tRNA(His) guanylyltransferase n=1 Tax=[Candida] anglica TaxID=148631 RepID=A0ABP0EBQ6_9ASCO